MQQQIDKLTATLEEARRGGKRQAAPFSKGAPKKDPKRPGRKPGKDHGRSEQRAVPERVDQVLHAPLPDRCPCCRGEVIEESIEAQYQTDIPPVQPFVRRFDVHVGHCQDCGKRLQGRHAEQTSDALGAACSQLGPRLVAFGAYLHQELGLPYQKTCDVLSHAFGVTVTSGGLSQALSRLAQRAEPSYARLLDEVRGSAAVYPDETSARMNGQRWWLWVFTTTMATVYVQRPSRGSDVIEEILGKKFAGLLGHDGWAPYDQLTEATHQQCLAHLIRRATDLLETATRGAVRFPRKVKKLLQDALRLRDRQEAGELSDHGFSVARGKIEKRLARVLEMQITNNGNRKFQGHLANHADDLLTFLYEDIEATNWPAEQAIRPAVRFRKTSGGHRSPRGARTRDVLLSLLRTARQRDLDPIPLLIRILRSPDPVLMPAP
ncbi:MAG: IS66 family transposase [Planctomycetota bacterium]